MLVNVHYVLIVSVMLIRWAVDLPSAGLGFSSLGIVGHVLLVVSIPVTRRDEVLNLQNVLQSGGAPGL